MLALSGSRQTNKMSPFAAFFDEVCNLRPERDHAPLADLLRCIETQCDDVAKALYDDVRQEISRTDQSVETRLVILDYLITKFVRH